MPESRSEMPQFLRASSSFGPYKDRTLSRLMLDKGTASAKDMLAAIGDAHQTGAPLERALVHNGLAHDRDVREALSIQFGASVLDPAQTPADAKLTGILDPEFCLRHSLVPWCRDHGKTVIACARPDAFLAVRNRLVKTLGPVRMVIAAEQVIQHTITQQHGPRLAHRAETWVRREDSCRDMNQITRLRAVIAVAAAGASLMLLAMAPDLFLLGIVCLALTSLFFAQLLKGAALTAGHFNRPPPVAPQPNNFPMVSLLVPLLHENDIAGTLVRRLGQLTYPKSCLEALLILEAGDEQTRAALGMAHLPPWMRVVEVPPGSITTKPRALNYAYRFCQGEVIGIYDAEDAPAEDQIERIVARFEQAPKTVACLQGMLDFYNPRANWLSRCFTIEYATWFRVLLPGLAKLGFAIPLGGTTVFFRREALQHVRGWDAHNVTEDADLGLRLARYGYKTEVVATVTHEEANNRAWPWVRQRSRWLKGYIITYLVHMRRPWALWRELGAWRFLGVQQIFLTAILQFTLAPALWSFWLIMVNVSHPFATWLPEWALTISVVLFLSCELIAMLAAFAAVAHTPHIGLMVWVPTMMLYFPLGVAAVYKAIWEIVARPFYWDKTRHGRSLPDDLPPAGKNAVPDKTGVVPPTPMLEARVQSASDMESSFKRVTKATEMWSRNAL